MIGNNVLTWGMFVVAAIPGVAALSPAQAPSPSPTVTKQDAGGRVGIHANPERQAPLGSGLRGQTWLRSGTVRIGAAGLLVLLGMLFILNLRPRRRLRASSTGAKPATLAAADVYERLPGPLMSDRPAPMRPGRR